MSTHGASARSPDHLPRRTEEVIRMTILRFLRGGLFLGLLVAAPVVAGEGLEERIAGVLKTPGYQDAHWGLLVVDAASGRTLYEKNADQLFCPASVTKLY